MTRLRHRAPLALTARNARRGSARIASELERLHDHHVELVHTWRHAATLHAVPAELIEAYVQSAIDLAIQLRRHGALAGAIGLLRQSLDDVEAAPRPLEEIVEPMGELALELLDAFAAAGDDDAIHALRARCVHAFRNALLDA